VRDEEETFARTFLDPSAPLISRKEAAEHLSRAGTATALSVLISAATMDLPSELARHVDACIARASATEFSEWDLRDWKRDAYLGWGDAISADEAGRSSQ
jgi:hypothetical protein